MVEIKIKIISGNLTKINNLLTSYGHDHYIDKDGSLVVDDKGVECLERILDIKYELVNK